MIETRKDLAWKEDIPQPFTSEDIEDIKASIDTSKANVNITPYHIYSPNEQVVGEWQQMVDGVLKKKPFYEKIYAYSNLTSSSSPQTLGAIPNTFIPETLSVFTKFNDGTVASIAYYQDANDSMWGDIDNYNIRFYCKWGGVNVKAYYKVGYTKTTDEWEVV